MWSRSLAKNYKSTSRFISLKNYSTTVTQHKTKPQESDISKFTVGERLHGFEVKEVKDINEFRITAVHLVHQKTKSEYLHLYRQDNNNYFSINFRTTPKNSTGLPHILEHTVLCGSELFPVRDPFFKMLNRSLATFMNAMTGSDYTLYPFGSQNLSDYRNLQKIYLDAVFRPSLKEMDFMQEGWRLENTDSHDINTPLIIKGVVYNEMKGVFAENESILGQKLQNLILPDHTYGVISGGDPKEIPNLTWEDLKNFHKNHYHPSNARFYSYGNFPLGPSLEYINKEYLSKFEYLQPEHTQVPKQKRWGEAKREHVACRFDNMSKEPIENQNAVTISLVMSDVTDIYDTFVIQFLSELLIRGPNSAFYKSMIEPNFSGGFSPSTGYDTQARDTIFTIGLQGVKKVDFARVEEIFDKTIDKVIKLGFDEQHIESVLHRYELSLKHESSNFGLHLLFGITALWNHSENVINALQVNELIGRLKNELKKDSKYLQYIVKKRFKENTHRLILTMSPDKNFEKIMESDEKALIENKTKNLTSEQRDEIYKKGLKLQEEQAAEQTTHLLPTLTMDDVSTDVERIPIKKVDINGIPVQINSVNCNEVVYFRSVLNVADLSQEQQMLLPLFCYIIDKLGTDKLDYRRFDSLVSRKTSGLTFNPFIGESLYQLHSFEPGVLISSYCLEKNVKDMFELWTQIFNISKLKDVDRFKTLVQLYMSNLNHGLADSGHVYAMQAASGLVSGSAYQRELLSGLQHIAYMKRLMHISNYPAMLREMTHIAHAVFNKTKMRCSLNLTDDAITQDRVLSHYERFLEHIPTRPKNLTSDKSYVVGKVWSPSDAVNCQHHILNVPVHYCSKAILTAPFSEPDYAKLRVLAKLLSTKYLFPELRERQGAYGGGARLTQDGVFAFFSYRDPRNLQTLDVFDKSHDWIQKDLAKVTPQEILEAKLGVFQAVDAPIPPGSKGGEEFLKRLDPDMLQRHRAEIMIVDQNGLKDVGEKYLSIDSGALQSKVIIGPKSDTWDTKQRADEMWTVVENV